MIEAMIQNYWINKALETYHTYPDVFTVGAVVLIIVGITGYTLHKTKKIPGEECKMKKAEYVLSKRQRRQRQNSLIADGVTNVLLDLFNKNELDQETFHRWHMRFGTQLGLKDLLPQPLTPELIRAASKKRINAGVYKPVNLPDKGVKKVHFKSKLDEILATATAK